MGGAGGRSRGAGKPGGRRTRSSCHSPFRVAWLLLLLGLPMAAPAATPAPAPETPAPARTEEAAAESAGPLPPEALASPRATMRSFLVAMNALFDDPEAWERALATLNLSLVPEGEGRQRARDLYAALNRIEEVDPAELPGLDQVEARGLESWRFFPDRTRHRKILARIGPPEAAIVLRPDDAGLWRFSADTVGEIPALRAQLEPLPQVAGREILTVEDWVEAHLPNELVTRELLGVKPWQALAIFLVLLAGLALDLAVRGLLRVLARRLTPQLEGRGDPATLRRTLRPFGLAAAAALWLGALRYMGLQGLAADVLEGALRIFLVAIATLAAWRVIDLGASVLERRAALSATRVDDVLVPLVTRSLKIFLVVMGVIYGAQALDIPITPLLASLTVAGVGFSFAAKDTVENFFGSVAVLLDRPFDIGDWVAVGETEGIVEAVGFRSTRVRTFYNSQVTMPNANLVRAVVDNFGRRRYRRWRSILSVQYDTPPDRLAAFTEGIRELVRLHPFTRKDFYHVWSHDFGASSLDVLLYVFFEVPDWATELRERERLMLDVIRLAERLGVQFAFPTRTLHVFPGTTPEPGQLPAPDAQSDAQARRHGVRAAHHVADGQPWRRERPDPVRFAPAFDPGAEEREGNDDGRGGGG